MKGITMAKFKLPKYKNIFYPRRYSGAHDWKEPTPVDYHFGNNHTEQLHQYKYCKISMGLYFSDYLKEDDRLYDKKATFTESEATILLLAYLEDHIKRARKEKKRLLRQIEIYEQNNTLSHNAPSLEYALTVNKRELLHLEPAVKIYRAKVKAIKKSKEYVWEQLLK